MKTKQHTPGPWEVGKHATPPAFPQFGIYSTAGNSYDLAIVKGENAEANAQLMAAAPRLLALVNDIKNRMDDYYTGNESWDEGLTAEINSVLSSISQ